jgi:hypothetical protein
MTRVYLVSESDLNDLKSALLDRSWLRPKIAEHMGTIDGTDAALADIERRFVYEFECWKGRAK